MGATSFEAGRRVDQLGTTRLRLLAAVSADTPAPEAMAVGLQQAAAALGALGGLVHVRSSSGGLSLLAACGLPREAAQAWVDLREDDHAPPARAVRHGMRVWAAGDSMGIGASGMLAVPVFGGGGPLGALSVVTALPGEPDLGQQSLLGEVTVWAARRLERLSEETPGPRPPPGQGFTVGSPVVEAARVLQVGGWEYDVRADAVTFAQWTPGVPQEARSAYAAGADLCAYLIGGRGSPSFKQDIVDAVRQGRAHEADYRLVREDGTCRCVRVYGRTVPGEHGEPPRMVGMLWDVPQPDHAVRGWAAERTARMGELTAALAEAITAKDVVTVVAERVLPPFGADGLIVEAIEGDRLHIVGAVGYRQDFLGRHLDGISVHSNVTVADVLRTRMPRFVESAAEFVRLYPQMASFMPLSGKRAWAFLPLIASGKAIGACVVSFSRPRSFSEEERTLLIALSGLVAQALERARLYDAEHTRAQELQRGLLPRTLPSVPAVSAAARYLPAGRGVEVGGDWYDVIPLSADRVALVIGDVMGHGIAEAATMGRLRTAVRTLADLEMAPDEILTHLNDLVSDLGDDYYATCLYAVYDPVTQMLCFSRAGHPPPAIVHPDGTVHCPDVPPDPPLGAARPPFGTHRLLLPEGSLLVLCTDGLIESATRDIDQGLAQLTRTLAATTARTPYLTAGHGCGSKRLEELCDVVVSALLPDREQTADDAALLIVRPRHTAPDDVVSWTLSEDPRAAGQARAHIRRQLDTWGLDDLVATTELLASELIGNVVRHAKGPIRLRLLRSRSLICEVYDGSLTTPRIRHAGYTDEGGRGLQLVAALAQRWGTRYLGDGKCIWTEQRLPHTADGTDTDTDTCTTPVPAPTPAPAGLAANEIPGSARVP